MPRSRAGRAPAREAARTLYPEQTPLSARFLLVYPRIFTSVYGCYEYVWKQASAFVSAAKRCVALEGLLIHDTRQDTKASLFEEDEQVLPWLRTLAKIASRDIRVFFVPVSKYAGNRLKRELAKLKNSAVQSATWNGKSRFWLSDSATQVNGVDRVQRVVSALIRAETNTHAFEGTDRRKVRKGHQQHEHSVFRQVAESFVPPAASTEAIEKNESNHPIAGASRKVGVTATRDYLANAGFTMFDTSKSGAARDKKAAGCREVHGIKDLQHPASDDEFTTGMVYTIVDQDMYIDDFARFAGENMCIITPEYNKLAGEGTDSGWFYTITSSGEVVVTERVASVNGATYTNQRPWDYSANDFIYIEHPGSTAFTTYNVHVQYQPGSHHKWVWLARNTTTELSKSVCDMLCEAAQGTPLDGVPLKKASNVIVVRGKSAFTKGPEYEHKTFLLGLFGDPKSPKYSIKHAYDQGIDTSLELTENQFRVFSLMGQNCPKGYGTTEVKRTMMMHHIWRPGGIEPLAVLFFGVPIEYRPRPNIMYTREDGSPDDGSIEQASAVQAAPNIAGGGPGVADTKSAAAHEAYEEKRFKAFSNKVDPAAPIKEIACILLPHFIAQVSKESGIPMGSVALVGRQEIYDRRTQALQAARLKRHSELDAREPLPKVNLKHEVASKASAAPRSITQYTEEMAIQTGRVGLLVKEVLKNCEFYHPGNSPDDIANAIRKVSAIAMYAQSDGKVGGDVSGMHDTDYSKMDETISQYIYSWFVDFVLYFVHPNDLEEVKTVLEQNVNLTTMLNGKLANTGSKNNSGSGVTTELNTVVSAFIEYVATTLAITKFKFRSTHGKELDLSTVKRSTIKTALAKYAQDTDLTHVLAGPNMFENEKIAPFAVPYAVIGPKFGDDGVAPHLPCITNKDWDEAAMFFTKGIGMVLKVAFSTPEDGTFFLGRYYPKPTGTLASYADVVNATRKISVARNIDLEKYVMKLRGYWTTDSKTPVIREYLTAVARIYKVELRSYEGIVELDEDGSPVLSKEMAHLLTTDRDMFYRVAGGPYCVTDEDIPLMLEAIAPQVNFGSSSELESWLASLAECETWEELDAFQLPGMDYDPDAEPAGTTRMAGPVTSLLAAQSSKSVHDIALDEIAEIADFALEQLLLESRMDTTDGPPLKREPANGAAMLFSMYQEQAGKKSPSCASA